MLPGGAKFCHICGTPVAAKEAGKSAEKKPDVDSSKKKDSHTVSYGGRFSIEETAWYQWDSVGSEEESVLRLDRDGRHIMRIFPDNRTMWVYIESEGWQERRIGTGTPGRSLDLPDMTRPLASPLWFDGEKYFAWGQTLRRFSFSETDGAIKLEAKIQLAPKCELVGWLFISCGDYFIYSCQYDGDRKTWYVPKNFEDEDDSEDNDEEFQLSSQIKELLPYAAD